MSTDTISKTESAIQKVTAANFVRAWRDNETVGAVARQCGLTKDETRAMAAALRSAGVKLPTKQRGRKTIVSKREAELLNQMLSQAGALLVDDIKLQEAQEDDDE